MRKYIFYILCIILSQSMFGQGGKTLSFSEYLGYIKKYHPIVKQAHLIINESEAKLLKARGAFDPKLEFDYERKRFKDTEYFNQLSATFKIPTWYGISIKGKYENNSGEFLNPERNVPSSGLYTLGVSISLAKGLLINERLATLKQAKLYKSQAQYDNQLLVNDILYKAAIAYFNWLKRYREKRVYEQFASNAALRFQGIKKSFELGDKPAIDTIEARISLNNRQLNLEKATLNYTKASLELSNYLWVNDVPVEVQEGIFPDTGITHYIDNALQINLPTLNIDLSNHPKLQSLDFKFRRLEIEKRLQKNNLLPKIDVQYDFLSEISKTVKIFDIGNYKAGISVSFPLLLRKERAHLKLTNYKLQAINFEKETTSLTLKNKLQGVWQEISSCENQIIIANKIISDYTLLLKGEKRKFEIGESSLFFINSRESKLIENRLKAIELENTLLKSKGKLFNLLGTD